jgi:predicted dithiol-disulfide oxidoreductase (DUF899 family)
MITHDVVSRADWVAARRALLVKEKELTRQRDELSRLRRALPWEAVEKDYAFEGPDGTRTLSELSEGRSQLVVYHMMSAGPRGETPCSNCSFWVDGFSGVVPHLNDRDVTLVVVSRAAASLLQAHAKRMGWTFPVLSSASTDFNFDYHVSFTPEQLESGRAEYNYTEYGWRMPDAPGVSVFARGPDGGVFHTYSCYARGLDTLNTAFQYLDLVPKGRNEDGLPFPLDWVRYHDEYQHAARAS